MLPRLFVIFILGNIFSIPCIAEVYKWVDENGKIHFSDKPFDDKSKAVKMKRQPTPEEIQQAKQRAAKVIQHQRKVNEIYSEETAEQQRVKAKRNKESAKICQEAKKEMKYMNGKYVNYTTNDKGERYYLTDDEKNALADKLKAAIAKHCPQ